MKFINKLRADNRGDTIIEVLIAIAVVSSVLGIAYSIMNLNIRTIRDNQERTEASRIAQSQIELIKSAWENNPNILNTSGSFCLNSTINRDSNPSGSRLTLDTTSYNLACRYGGSASTDAQGFYFIDITRNSSSGYTVNVRWNKVGGGLSSLVMGYKLE